MQILFSFGLTFVGPNKVVFFAAHLINGDNILRYFQVFYEIVAYDNMNIYSAKRLSRVILQISANVGGRVG